MTEWRQAVFFLLAIPESMCNSELVQLNNIFRGLIENILSNYSIGNKIEIELITSEMKNPILYDFSSVDKFVLPPLNVTENTSMTSFILEGIGLVEKRIEQYKDSGFSCHTPLIFMTTSCFMNMNPEDSKWKEVFERIYTGEKSNLFCFYAMDVDQTNKKILQQVVSENKIISVKNIVEMIVNIYSSNYNSTIDIHNSEIQSLPSLKKPYIIGASVIGSSHKNLNLPLQDSYSYEILSSSNCICIVSDGLGSANKSDIGAKIAVDTAVSTWKNLQEANGTLNLEIALNKIVTSSRNAILQYAEDNKCQLKDLACTIIVVVYYNQEIGVAHIGDGAVVAKNDNELFFISEPEESEYVNEVVPITSKNWENFLRISVYDSSIECLFIFSDGCQRASISKVENKLQPYDRFFNPLFKYAIHVNDIKQADCDIKRFLESNKMSQTSDDDKTLVMIILKEKEVEK